MPSLLSQWTRESLANRFGPRPVFVMVHLRPLPGSPLFEGSFEEVIASALRDAQAISRGGASGFVIENFGDRPFYKEAVEPVTVVAMTRAVLEIKRVVKLPFGINVLRNDAQSALTIGAVTGAAFIRVNVHCGTMLTDQGIVEGKAAETLRLRRKLGEEIGIVADHRVKHGVPLGDYDELLAAKDLRMRGLADALVVTGPETGAPADISRLEKLRAAIDAPIFVGSGVTMQNAASYSSLADALIVGTSVKKDGDVGRSVDQARVQELVRAFRDGARTPAGSETA